MPWIGIGRSKYQDWVTCFGKVNEHNAWIPRDHWLNEDESCASATSPAPHLDDGYRRMTFMMLDADVVACSPSSVYRVLKKAGLLSGQTPNVTKKGTGHVQPLKAHQEWHVDVSYLNIAGTFYFLCSILDGYSRFIVHWDIRPNMEMPTRKPSSSRPAKNSPASRPASSATTGRSSSPRISKSSSASWA